MTTELPELYQKLGQLVWELFQERATESLMIKLAQQSAPGVMTGSSFEVDATVFRIDEIRVSIADVLADIQQHPNGPEEPMLLRRLRAMEAN